MSKKQNLVVLANPFVTSRSLAGGDIYYLELADYLKKNYKVSVILPAFAKKHWAKRKVKFFTLKRNIFDQSEKRVFLFAAYLIRSFQTFKLLQKFPGKTIVASSSDFFPDVLPVFFSKLRGKRYFWVARFYHLASLSNKNVNTLQNLISFSLQRLSTYLAVNKADLILVDNNKTADYFLKKGIKTNRLLISGGSVDLKKIIKPKTKNEKIYDAVFAGRLDYTKGVFDLPQIWADVVKVLPKAKLAIAGTATRENLARLKSLISQNQIEKNINLLGFLPHNGRRTIFDIFSESKLFLSLTLEGGRDYALVEAMAAGLPVVAYDQDFLSEGTIKKGFELVNRRDKKAAAKKIIELLRTGKKRTALAKEARGQAKAFDWGKTYKTLYRSLSVLRN